MSDGTPQGTRTYLDGVELTNVKELNIHIGSNDQMLATLTAVVYVDELEINGDVRIQRYARDVARMTDQEALERAILLIGEVRASELQEKLIEMLQRAITGNAERQTTFGPR